MQRLMSRSPLPEINGGERGRRSCWRCAAGTCRAPFLSLSPLLPVTDDTAAARRIQENTFTSGQTCPGPRPSRPPPQPRSYSHPVSTVSCTSLTELLFSRFPSSPCTGRLFLFLSFNVTCSVIEDPTATVGEKYVRAWCPEEEGW